jgi:hypothetical protein
VLKEGNMSKHNSKKYNVIENLVTALQEKNYKVIKTPRSERKEIYDYYDIKGNCIKGGFCTSHPADSLWASYEALNGKIAVDHKDCFDKWRKCPLILPLPTSIIQLDWLMNRLLFWGTAEGYLYSNQFEYDKYDLEYRV